MKATLDNLPQTFLLQQGIYTFIATYIGNLSSLCLHTDLLEYFTQCTDLDTPAQFIERYCKPTHIVLDSGVCHIYLS